MQPPLFAGRRAVLATRHAKEKVIAPILKRTLGIEVFVPPNFDSDVFGTFTRDIPRVGTQLEAARKKALAAMEQTGADMALSSEGSFGPDPTVPYVQSNTELVLLIDRAHELEIVGSHHSLETNMNSAYVSSVEEALQCAQAWGFPEHGVIVRKSESSAQGLHKELHTPEALTEHVEQLLTGIFTKKVFLETDMRAHRNPTRMKNIALATEELVRAATSLCPSCATPGFVVTRVVRGVPCAWCGQPTELVAATISECAKCAYAQESRVSQSDTADPGMCGFCNP